MISGVYWHVLYLTQQFHNRGWKGLYTYVIRKDAPTFLCRNAPQPKYPESRERVISPRNDRYLM